jgi:hypothetical protein
MESQTQGEVSMTGQVTTGQVILYFEDQADALRFALAAGSVMAGDTAAGTSELVRETTRVTRILLDADKGKGQGQNQGQVKTKPSSPPERAV